MLANGPRAQVFRFLLEKHTYTRTAHTVRFYFGRKTHTHENWAVCGVCGTTITKWLSANDTKWQRYPFDSLSVWWRGKESGGKGVGGLFLSLFYAGFSGQ